MGKKTQKIARSLGSRLGRLIDFALYDTRYKKVYLPIEQCKDYNPHTEHVWVKSGGYVPSTTPRACEGVNVYAYAQKDDLEPEMVPRTEDSAR